MLIDAALVLFAVAFVAGWACARLASRNPTTPGSTRPDQRVAVGSPLVADSASCSRRFQTGRQGGDTGCVRLRRRIFDWSLDAPEVA